MQHVPQIRVFLASPGDVNEERKIALEVLDMLEYDPLFRRGRAGGVSIHAVAWDKPGGDTPMRATLTPQTAIKQGLPRPSVCDIVLVFFWGRMGTPLPHTEYQKDDGAPFLSGTEWEYHDAVTAERAQGKPLTFIYRRSEKPPIDIDDDDKVQQYTSVKNFFKQFQDASGAYIGGVNEYKTPEDLRGKLTTHLRQIILDVLDAEMSIPSAAERPHVEAPPLWEGSPFPGLRAFTEDDAPIYFGRGVETGELVKRVAESRFVAVVAASGSGKSSLVAAGLIARLRANAIANETTGSKDWRYVRFTPGGVGSVLASLFYALCEAFPESAPSPFSLEAEKTHFVASISSNPASFITIIDALLKQVKAPAWAEVLLFIDQFEELFTLVAEADREPFVTLLQAAHASTRLRVIVTMRSDFYANCLDIPALAELLKDAGYPLAAPTAGALIQMIERPAERAGLTWDEGLPDQIVQDVGTSSGALALMAYALDELYKLAQVRGDKRLTLADYRAIGGLDGAIGVRAEQLFDDLGLAEKERLLQRVFRELVSVDERGTATRQRAGWGKFDDDERALIAAFANARLLVTHDEGVEVAHEAVFRSWERLKAWIAESQEDLILLRQMRAAAEEWAYKNQPEYLLWQAERLALVYAMIERQQPPLSEKERNFIELEQARLYRELLEDNTNHERRRDIGDRLSVIGTGGLPEFYGMDVRDGLPEIFWLPVAGSDSEVEFFDEDGEDGESYGTFVVKPLYVAKYLITYEQFQTFLQADDGFDNPLWWRNFPNDYQRQKVESQRTKGRYSPRDTVSWYQAVAFARWLNHRLTGTEAAVNSGWIPYDVSTQMPLVIGRDTEVRLPTEWEWQWLAQNGREEWEYAWGAWQEGMANTKEAGLSRTTAVGVYPGGAAACGAVDVSGNLWEWCLNLYEQPNDFTIYRDGADTRTMRGGSWYALQYNAATVTRVSNIANMGGNNYGIRLVLAAPIRISDL